MLCLSAALNSLFPCKCRVFCSFSSVKRFCSLLWNTEQLLVQPNDVRDKAILIYHPVRRTPCMQRTHNIPWAQHTAMDLSYKNIARQTMRELNQVKFCENSQFFTHFVILTWLKQRLHCAVVCIQNFKSYHHVKPYLTFAKCKIPGTVFEPMCMLKKNGLLQMFIESTHLNNYSVGEQPTRVCSA